MTLDECIVFITDELRDAGIFADFRRATAFAEVLEELERLKDLDED